MADITASPPKTTPISTFALNPIPTDFAQQEFCSGIYLDDSILKIDNKRDCLPNGFATDQSIFYSPGVQCPTGYTAQPACTRTGGVEGITTVTCCPVRGDITMSCVDDDASLSPPWTSQFCTWKAGPRTVVLATETGSDGNINTKAETLEGAGGVNAFGIRMVYQSTDLGEAAQETGGSAGATSTSGANRSPSLAADESGGGMSQSAKIAVGVTVPIIALLLFGAGLFMWRRRKRSRQTNEQATSDYGFGDQDIHQAIVEHANNQAAKTLLSETPKPPMAELSSAQPPAELPAGPPTRQPY